MSKLNLRNFEKTDWYAYAGAASFDDDDEPKIANYEVNGEHVTVIVDMTGAEIYIGRTKPDGDYEEYATIITDRSKIFSKGVVLAFGRGLVVALNEMLDTIEKPFDIKPLLEGSNWNLKFDKVL